MEQFARFASSSEIRALNIERSFSNFDWIEENFGDSGPIRRLFSQIRQLSGKSLVFEKLNDAAELIEENEDIKKQLPEFKSSASYRLSFFSQAISSEEEISRIEGSSFLGYAIIKRDSFADGIEDVRIFESVIRKSRHEHNYIRKAPKWKCLVADSEFEIEGYIYAQ
ncbi:MAG TPA: hypothetical protein VM658_14495 [bacterium]|nr:hypothetical protein [bacterium]